MRYNRNIPLPTLSGIWRTIKEQHTGLNFSGFFCRDGDQVIFSDEFLSLLSRSNGRVYVRRREGEKFRDALFQVTVKCGRVK